LFQFLLRWGTVVGMKAALARPDLFYAYVGIGPGDQHPHQ